VLNVETANTVIRAAASGARIELSTPVSARSNTPSSRKHRQPSLRDSHESGASSDGQTIDSSSVDREMEMNEAAPCRLSGITALAGKRQIENSPSNTVSVSTTGE